jgi:2-hydroxychromene-2-carboxylate isomerase
VTDTASPLADLDGGPYDIEFFFDPGCPFAWQTSVWIRRVQELQGIKVGWRFISLKFINEGNDVPPQFVVAQTRGLGYHRICAAARERFGNDAVGRLYEAYGKRYWYEPSGGELLDRFADAAERVDPAEILAELDLPADLVAAADDDSWDGLIRAESEEAFRRTGNDVGTPIITYDPPNGSSLFGPVISSIPDDDLAVRFYEALRTFADFGDFSELKRSDRAQLDLPLFAD